MPLRKSRIEKHFIQIQATKALKDMLQIETCHNSNIEKLTKVFNGPNAEIINLMCNKSLDLKPPNYNPLKSYRNMCKELKAPLKKFLEIQKQVCLEICQIKQKVAPNEVVEDPENSLETTMRRKRKRNDELSKKYDCPFENCSKAYSAKSSQKLHVKRIHQNEMEQAEKINNKVKLCLEKTEKKRAYLQLIPTGGSVKPRKKDKCEPKKKFDSLNLSFESKNQLDFQNESLNQEAESTERSFDYIYEDGYINKIIDTLEILPSIWKNTKNEKKAGFLVDNESLIENCEDEFGKSELNEQSIFGSYKLLESTDIDASGNDDIIHRSEKLETNSFECFLESSMNQHSLNSNLNGIKILSNQNKLENKYLGKRHSMFPELGRINEPDDLNFFNFDQFT